MPASLECILIIFLFVLIITLVILCVYLSKLIQEASEAAKSIKELADLAKKELEPAFKSVNNVLKTADNVSAGVNRLAKIPMLLLGAAAGAVVNMKGRGGFLSGLASGFKLVKKRR